MTLTPGALASCVLHVMNAYTGISVILQGEGDGHLGHAVCWRDEEGYLHHHALPDAQARHSVSSLWL